MKAVTSLSFEEALNELESIVRKLEEGNLPLEDSIKTYERGILLKNHCDGKLKAAQIKIEEVIGSSVGSSDGGPQTKPFEMNEG